ncbi:MAG: hypothetical protein N4A57_15740 [Anaeromicrobium sp.]|jgi:hypothetical protein|uniref:hypothetical protein n=1 Tax=Anaeromicrobium sp. TaxID=1929132 RepID=UPI0025F511E2|nr:hypothetical protein [Anaeromicrobium sp.]MCT4595700.1 hypothetical protein [Anaeromicrobium sp.]
MFYFGIVTFIMGALLGYTPKFVINFFGQEKIHMVKILGFIICILSFLTITRNEYPASLEFIRIF